MDTTTGKTDDILADLAAGRSVRGEPAAAEALRTRAGEDGLTLVLARGVKDGSLRLPEPVASRVADDAMALRRQASSLRLEARRIGNAAARAGLAPPVLLKGPAVARRWSDPALRPFGDLDLLVPEGELSAWRRELEALGYAGPTPWQERNARRFHHHLLFHRPGPGANLIVEVHWRLFAARGARELTYELLAAGAGPSPSAPGLLELDDSSQVLVLAVHLAHHEARDRRLVWLRDFIELGSNETAEGARRLAEARGLAWALENALASAERVLGEARWSAKPSRPPAGLPRARERARGRVAPHVGMVRELGPWAGARYLLSRLDPRRFRGPTGRMEWARLRGWLRRNLGRRKPGGGQAQRGETTRG